MQDNGKLRTFSNSYSLAVVELKSNEVGTVLSCSVRTLASPRE